MPYRSLLLATLFTAPLAMAAEARFQGHAVEWDDASAVHQVLRVTGTRYAVPGSPEQIVGRAQMCLSRKESMAGVVSVDRDAGRLTAVSRVEYRDEPALRLAKGWITVEAGEGFFNVVLSRIGILQASTSETAEEVFSPLALGGDHAWEPALAALIAVEEALVDCVFG